MKVMIVLMWVFGFSTSLAAASPNSLTGSQMGDGFLEVFVQWGLAGVVIAYVLYRDHQRETSMRAQSEEEQRWIKETLITAINQSTTAINRVNDTLNKRDFNEKS